MNQWCTCIYNWFPEDCFTIFQCSDPGLEINCGFVVGKATKLQLWWQLQNNPGQNLILGILYVCNHRQLYLQRICNNTPPSGPKTDKDWPVCLSPSKSTWMVRLCLFPSPLMRTSTDSPASLETDWQTGLVFDCLSFPPIKKLKRNNFHS